jgi:hypothetical protein
MYPSERHDEDPALKPPFAGVSCQTAHRVGGRHGRRSRPRSARHRVGRQTRTTGRNIGATRTPTLRLGRGWTGWFSTSRLIGRQIAREHFEASQTANDNAPWVDRAGGRSPQGREEKDRGESCNALRRALRPLFVRQPAASLHRGPVPARAEHAACEGWNVAAHHLDAAISGSSMILRPGHPALACRRPARPVRHCAGRGARPHLP